MSPDVDSMWEWRVIGRLNLHDVPAHEWEPIYHWLNDELPWEVVMKVNEDLEWVAFIVRVTRDDTEGGSE